VEIQEINKTSRPFKGMPNGLLERIAERLTLSAEQRTALEHMRYDYNPHQSFVHRFRRRGGTPGYSMEFQRAHAQYFWSFGNYYARVKYTEDIQAQIRQLYRVASYMPTANRLPRTQIANFLAEFHDEMRDTRSDWTALRSLAFFWFLGGVPSTALLNLSQISMGTYPYLAQQYGDRKAAAATLNAGRQFYRWWKLDDPANMPAGELSIAMHEAQLAGIIDGVFAHELAGIADGANLRRWAGGNEFQRGLHLVQEALAWMFHTTEKINRVTTFVAAYHLAEQGIPKSYANDLRLRYGLLLRSLRDRGWTERAAMRYAAAVDAVDTTQYMFSRWARPKLFRGKAGNLFIFKSFAQNTLFNLWTQPGLRTRYLLMSAIIGGAMGIPGMEDMEELIQVLGYRLFGKDWSAKEQARKAVVEWLDGPGYMADLILHGLSRYGYGIPAALDATGGLLGAKDVPFPVLDRSRARSLGKLSPVPVGELLGVEAEKDYGKAMTRGLERVAGVLGGFSINEWQALINSQNETDDVKRWSRATPRFTQNLSRAYRIYRDQGETTRSGASVGKFDVRNPNWTPRWDSEHFYEMLAIAAGYQPTRMTREWDRIRLTQHVNTFWNLRRTGLLAQYSSARRANSGEDTQAVEAAIKKFNEDLPKEAEAKKITEQTLARSWASRERTRQRQEEEGATSRMDQGVARSIRRLFENRAAGRVKEERPVSTPDNQP
jgi:hypothetical protein